MANPKPITMNAHLIDALGIYHLSPQFLSRIQSSISQLQLKQQLFYSSETPFDPNSIEFHLNQPQIYLSLWTSTDPASRPFAISSPSSISHQPLCYLPSPPSDQFQLLEIPTVDNPLYNDLFIKFHITNIPSLDLIFELQQHLYELEPSLLYYKPAQQHRCEYCAPHSNSIVNSPPQYTAPFFSLDPTSSSTSTAPFTSSSCSYPSSCFQCYLDPVLFQTEFHYRSLTPYRAEYLPLLNQLPINSRLMVYVNSTVYFIIPEIELRLLYLQNQITSIQQQLLHTPTDSSLVLALDGFYTDYAFLQCKHFSSLQYWEQRKASKQHFLNQIDIFPDLYEKLKALPFPLPPHVDTFPTLLPPEPTLSSKPSINSTTQLPLPVQDSSSFTNTTTVTSSINSMPETDLLLTNPSTTSISTTEPLTSRSSSQRSSHIPSPTQSETQSSPPPSQLLELSLFPPETTETTEINLAFTNNDTTKSTIDPENEDGTEIVHDHDDSDTFQFPYFDLSPLQYQFPPGSLLYGETHTKSIEHRLKLHSLVKQSHQSHRLNTLRQQQKTINRGFSQTNSHNQSSSILTPSTPLPYSQSGSQSLKSIPILNPQSTTLALTTSFEQFDVSTSSSSSEIGNTDAVPISIGTPTVITTTSSSSIVSPLQPQLDSMILSPTQQPRRTALFNYQNSVMFNVMQSTSQPPPQLSSLFVAPNNNTLSSSQNLNYSLEGAQSPTSHPSQSQLQPSVPLDITLSTSPVPVPVSTSASSLDDGILTSPPVPASFLQPSTIRQHPSSSSTAQQSTFFHNSSSLQPSYSLLSSQSYLPQTPLPNNSSFFTQNLQHSSSLLTPQQINLSLSSSTAVSTSTSSSYLPTYSDIFQNPVHYLRSLPAPISLTPILPPSIFTSCDILDFENRHPSTTTSSVSKKQSLLSVALNSSILLPSTIIEIDETNHSISEGDRSASISYIETPGDHNNGTHSLSPDQTPVKSLISHTLARSLQPPPPPPPQHHSLTIPSVLPELVTNLSNSIHLTQSPILSPTFQPQQSTAIPSAPTPGPGTSSFGVSKVSSKAKRLLGADKATGTSLLTKAKQHKKVGSEKQSSNTPLRRPLESMVQRLYTLYHFDGAAQLLFPMARTAQYAPHLRYGSDGGPSLTPIHATNALAARRGRHNAGTEQRSVQSVLDTTTTITLTGSIVSSKIKVFRLLQQHLQLIHLSSKLFHKTVINFFAQISSRLHLPNTISSANTIILSLQSAQSTQPSELFQLFQVSRPLQPLKRIEPIPLLTPTSTKAKFTSTLSSQDLDTFFIRQQQDSEQEQEQEQEQKQQSTPTSTLPFFNSPQLSHNLSQMNQLIVKSTNGLAEEEKQPLLSTSIPPANQFETNALHQESHLVNASREVIYKLRQQVYQQRQLAHQRREVVKQRIHENEKTEQMLRFHSEYLVNTYDNFTSNRLPTYNRTLEQIHQTNIRVQYRRSKLVHALSLILPILSHHSESCKTRLTSILFPTLYETREKMLSNSAGLISSQATLNAISNDQFEHRLAQDQLANPAKKSRFSSMLSSISLLSTTNASINNKIFSATTGSGKFRSNNQGSVDIYHTDLSKLSKSQQQQIHSKHALFQTQYDKYISLYGHQVYSICNIPLFLSPILLTDISVHDLLTQTSIALGYVAQLVNTLADYLQVKLRYPLFPNGPRSGVFMNFPDRCSILPLYPMSVVEKSFLPERHLNFLLLHLSAMELPLFLLYPHSTLYPSTQDSTSTHSNNTNSNNQSSYTLSNYHPKTSSAITDFSTTTFSTSGQLVMNQSIYASLSDSTSPNEEQSLTASQSQLNTSRQNPTTTPSKRERKDAQLAAMQAANNPRQVKINFVDPTSNIPVEQRCFLAAIFLLNLNVLQLLSATLTTSQLNDPTHPNLYSTNNPYLSVEHQATHDGLNLNVFSPSISQHRHICATTFENGQSTSTSVPPRSELQQIQPPTQTHYLAPTTTIQPIYTDSSASSQYNLHHYMTDYQAVLESYQRDITARLHVMRNEGKIATFLPFKTHSAHLLENLVLLIQTLAPSM